MAVIYHLIEISVTNIGKETWIGSFNQNGQEYEIKIQGHFNSVTASKAILKEYHRLRYEGLLE